MRAGAALSVAADGDGVGGAEVTRTPNVYLSRHIGNPRRRALPNLEANLLLEVDTH